MIFCSCQPQFGNNATTSDTYKFDKLQMIRQKFVTRGLQAVYCGAIISLLAMLAACGPEQQEPAPATVMPTLAQTAASDACGDNGRLHTELFGALAGPLDWSADDLKCSGMPRPNGEGARLRFAAQVGDIDRRLAIIIAMPALERHVAGSEISSKVTLIDEGSGRFFSTWDLDSCWTDITTLEPLDDSGDRFEIGGNLYCVAPLTEVNGEGSVSISELDFMGLLDWSAR